MKTKKVVMCGFGIALIFTLTAFTAISIAPFGYVNFGDSAILLLSSLLGPIPSMLVSGIGSAMADLYIGYPQYAIFTFIIKGLEGYMVSYLFTILPRKAKPLGFIAGIIVMILGYYLVDALMFSNFIAALVAVQGNVVQGIVCLLFALLAHVPFSKIADNHPNLFKFK